MPIAAISAVASIGGAVLGSKAQKKAAKTAANAATDNTAQNNALAREIYGENKATLSPFVQSGTRAGSAINALLGLGGPAPTVGNAPAQNSIMGATFGAAPGASYNQGGQFWRGEPMNALMPYSPDGTFVSTQGNSVRPPQPAPNVGAGNNPLSQYQDAFANYRNSTGYQFRLGEGQRALDNSYASRGVGQSGAAAKAAANYGQNIASDEFNNYLNALMSQQGVGLSAAGAQAGVSTNFVNQTTQNNNNAASALANAAIAKGNANSNMWGGIANGLGGLFGSSFG